MPAVIFVDDDELFLKVLTRYFQLKMPTVQLHTCASGEACLAQLPLLQPALIVIDYHLDGAGIQGAALIRAIRATGSQARVVVLSGREREQLLPELADVDVAAFVLKDAHALPTLTTILGTHLG